MPGRAGGPAWQQAAAASDRPQAESAELADGWEAEWQALAEQLFDEAWSDEAGLAFLLEVSGPRVGTGDARHDWVCEVAAPRLYAIQRRAPAPDPAELVRVLGLGRAGSIARGEWDLLAWPTLEAAGWLVATSGVDAALAHIAATRDLLPAEHPHHLPLLRREALLAADRGRFEEALARLDQVEERIGAGSGKPWSLHANQRDRAAILLRMGLVDLAAREIGRAGEGLESAYASGQAVKGPLVNLYCTWVHIYLTQSRFEEVVEQSERWLEERAELFAERPGGRATMLFNAALAHEFLGYGDGTHRKRARDAFEELLAIPEASLEEQTRSRVGLARLDVCDGRSGDGRERLEAIEAPESLSRIAAIELETARGRALLGMAAQRSFDSAAEASELLRLRRVRLTEAIAAFADEVRAEAPRPGGVGFLGYRAYRAGLATLMDLELELGGVGGAEAALRILFEGQRLHSLVRALDPHGTAGFEALQDAVVPAGGGVLVFFPSEEGSHLFAFDAARCVHAKTEGLLALRSAAAPWTSLLQRSPSGLEAEARAEREARWRTAAAELFRRILPAGVRDPVQEWRSLVVVGGDHLRGLPIECLIPPGGEPIGLTKAVSHLPSLPLGVLLAREGRERGARRPARDLVLVVDPLRGAAAAARFPDQADFRMTPAEIDGLCAPFDPSRRALALGPEASLDAVTRLATGGARILHFVTHGIRDSDRESSRGLLLSADAHHDGTLFADGVPRLPSCDLAVLSACASAQGPWRGGDEQSATLVGAFLRAGSLGVLSYTSEVELAPTLVLGAAFHRGLARGATPAEALRTARRATIDAGYTDPYAFGLARITGWAHAPLLPSAAALTETSRASEGEARLWPWMLGGVLLLGVVAGVRRRRAARG